MARGSITRASFSNHLAVKYLSHLLRVFEYIREPKYFAQAMHMELYIHCVLRTNLCHFTYCT